MLPGAAGANRKPVLLPHSGRVHPNPLFQQAYAFTGVWCRVWWSFPFRSRISPTLCGHADGDQAVGDEGRSAAPIPGLILPQNRSPSQRRAATS